MPLPHGVGLATFPSFNRSAHKTTGQRVAGTLGFNARDPAHCLAGRQAGKCNGKNTGHKREVRHHLNLGVQVNGYKHLLTIQYKVMAADLRSDDFDYLLPGKLIASYIALNVPLKSKLIM